MFRVSLPFPCPQVDHHPHAKTNKHCHSIKSNVAPVNAGKELVFEEARG